jgi:regulator of replication initiation timing
MSVISNLNGSVKNLLREYNALKDENRLLKESLGEYRAKNEYLETKNQQMLTEIKRALDFGRIKKKLNS